MAAELGVARGGPGSPCPARSSRAAPPPGRGHRGELPGVRGHGGAAARAEHLCFLFSVGDLTAHLPSLLAGKEAPGGASGAKAPRGRAGGTGWPEQVSTGGLCWHPPPAEPGGCLRGGEIIGEGGMNSSEWPQRGAPSPGKPGKGRGGGTLGRVVVLGRAVVLHRPPSERDRARRGWLERAALSRTLLSCLSFQFPNF